MIMHGIIFAVHGFYLLESRQVVLSYEAKKKQHVCTSSGLRDQYNELFTQMAGTKVYNTVT